MPVTTARTPRQDRSKASLERMLDVTEQLLVERPQDSFTLQQVSELSGASIGSISFRFGSKDHLTQAALLRALERIMAQEADMIARVRTDAWNIDTFVTSYVSEFADFLQANGPLLRQVMRQAARDPLLAAKGQLAVTQGAELARQAFLDWRGSFGGTRPEEKVGTVFHIIFSTLARQLGINILGEPAFFQDLQDLKRELAWLTLSYLKSPY